METTEFAGFLSGVATRLRHDLKGGLITLRMGLEALPDGEDLKPLLVDRALHLETLADKLVLLLRMGEMMLDAVRLSAVLGEFRGRVADRLPGLEIGLPGDLGDAKPRLDSDALLYALMEVAENARLAGAKTLQVKSVMDEAGLCLIMTDDGKGVSAEDGGDPLGRLGPLGVSRWGRAGLGLAIAERCARGHGGDLTMRTLENGGLEVTLRLGGSTP